MPENIKKRIGSWFTPDKYPKNRVCHFHEFTEDNLAREIKYVESMSYNTDEDNVLCTVPQGFLDRPSAAEEELERNYGTGLMTLLADKLSDYSPRINVGASTD